MHLTLKLPTVFQALLFTFAAGLGLACKSTTQDTSETKIIGGSEEQGDPAVVAIYVEIMAREARFMCTGTLIAEDLVLTAAHCLNQPRLGFAHVFRIFTGTDLRDKEDRPAAVTGREAHFDKEFQYRHPELGHDIGVLKLKEPMPIKPVPYLRGPLSQDLVGTKVRAVGYGLNSSVFDSGSQVKRSTKVKVNAIKERFIEVGGFFHNVCRGDSGGPILMEIDGVETIIGVNSYGNGSCHSSSTATRVDYYAPRLIDPLMTPGSQP